MCLPCTDAQPNISQPQSSLMTFPTRRRFLSAVAVAAVSGCVSRGSVSDSPASSLEGGADSTDRAGGSDTVPSIDDRLPLPMDPAALRDNAMSGGPSKDGIPSIDEPKFLAPDEVDYLAPGDPVFGVVRDGHRYSPLRYPGPGTGPPRYGPFAIPSYLDDVGTVADPQSGNEGTLDRYRVRQQLPVRPVWVRTTHAGDTIRTRTCCSRRSIVPTGTKTSES